MNAVMNDAIVALIDQNISRATGSKASIKALSLAGEKTLRKLRIENAQAAAAHVGEMTLVRDTGPIALTDSQQESLLKLVSYIESIKFCQRLHEDRVSITIYECEEDASFCMSDAPTPSFSFEADGAKRLSAPN